MVGDAEEAGCPATLTTSASASAAAITVATTATIVEKGLR